MKKLLEDILAVPSESRTLEFKRIGIKKEGLDRTLQSIVAMANTDGGLWPPRYVDVPEKGRKIALLFVPKATDGLRSYENHVFIRLEKGNRRLSPQEIIHFSYIKGFNRADAELVDVAFSLLKTHYYETWRRERGISDNDIAVVLYKTGLAREDNQGELRPTRAAVLLFAEYPNDLMETKCTIRIFQYSGNLETVKETINLIGVPKTIGGCVMRQIKDAHDYVLMLLRAGMRVPSGFVTSYRIPERAVKEAITNAVIHRDYHTKRDIEIKIYEDRLEVESPGLLPFNITPSNIGYERAYGYRNDLLVKHLREFPDPPNLDQNEGVRAMRQVMRADYLFPPIFITYPFLQDSVKVILLNEKAPSEWDKTSDYLNKNKYINNKEARAIMGIHDTSKVSRFLGKWVKQGLLVKIVPTSGAKKNVCYRLPITVEKDLFATDVNK